MYTYTNQLLSSLYKSYIYVTIIATLATILGVIINGIIIGNFLGNIGLVAFGIATPITYGILAISYIFANGGSIVCSNNMTNEKRVNNNFTVTCTVSLIISIVLTIVLYSFSQNIAMLLGASNITLIPTTAYLRGIILGIIPNIFTMIFINYSRIDGYPKLGFITSIIITIANLILDLIFILVFNWGIGGVAIATSLSYCLGTIITLYHFLSDKSSYKLTKNIEFINEIKEIIKTGIPSALNQTYNMFRTIITNTIGITIGGVILMGALSIQSNVYMLLCGVGVGIGSTTMALGGIFYGNHDKKLVTNLLKMSVKYALLVIVSITIILFIFAPFFVQLFGKNPEVYDTAINGLRIFSFSLPFSGLCYIFLNFYNATKQLKIANYIGFAHSFLFLSLSAIILSNLTGTNGLWLSFTVGHLSTLIGLLIIIKLKTGKFPRKIEDMVIMEHDEFPEENMLNTSISNENSLLKLSEDIPSLLKDENLNEKTLNRISLIIEEIGKNILIHGFKSKKDKHLDIRIKY
ncbi:MAG: MATE family efflux transporter, partial [Methanobacteriaceae archaeon]|nr:MATE family efflux transporter [Methanobacteriaceae archaeon]